MKINFKEIFIKLRTWLFTEIKEDLKSIHERLDKLELNVLKLVITSEKTPLNEKLIAGDIYIKKGGNGEIESVVKVLKEEYEEELKKK